MPKPILMNAGHSDFFQTPPVALKPLLRYLVPGSVVWEPSAGVGQLANQLYNAGFPTIRSDILDGQDFLTWEPDEHYDVIITNPPYSIKDKFLARAFRLKKPFAFLLPVTALAGKARMALYRTHGLQLLMLNDRINFNTPSGVGSGSWFATAWFTWGILPADLIFDPGE